MNRLVLVASLLATSACLPSFDDVECYADIDCPGGFVCGPANTCVDPGRPPSDAGATDAAVQTGDAGGVDAGGVDAGAVDDGGVVPDASSPSDAAAAPDASGAFDAGSAPDAAASNDGGSSSANVTLTPVSIDYGSRPLGCPAVLQNTTLENVGGTDAIVRGMFVSSTTPADFVVQPPATPYTLAAGARLVLPVAFTAMVDGVRSGELQVVWEGGPMLETTLVGRGTTPPTDTDTFMPVRGEIDILVVVDDSASMGVFQSILADRVGEMITTLTAQGWDYQIGVTTTDVTVTGPAGALVGTPPIITAQTSNPAMTLATRVGVGTAGSGTERGLDASRLALSAPLITGANQGFLRTDAALMVVYVTDEDDSSTANVSVYTGFLLGLKGGDTTRVVANPVVSEQTSCSWNGGSADFGGRYLGARDLTMGTSSHICSFSWSAALTTFPPISRVTDYDLSSAPNPGTIEVRVDGTVVANGWAYDAPNNRVVFDPASAPDFGTTVTIRYAPPCP